MATITHRLVTANGIRLHIAEAGPADGPCVIMCHGFPESWYSWRHQLHALGDAGYHAVAPDIRGMGRSSRPLDPNQYTQPKLVGDMVGLLGALPHDTAVIAGHDWGAPVAWNAALMRPDLFPAVDRPERAVLRSAHHVHLRPHDPAERLDRAGDGRRVPLPALLQRGRSGRGRSRARRARLARRLLLHPLR